MKKKKKLPGRCIFYKFKFDIFFLKKNIIKYFKTMENCKNSITIINEISLSIYIYMCVCVCARVCACI